MALEFSLEKAEGESWGFRLTGGAEFDVPLTVIKVAENSVAESVGLQTEDVIVRINDTPTVGLTHTQSHNLLLTTGNHLLLGIRRGEGPVLIYRKNEEEDTEECLHTEDGTKIEKQVHFELATTIDEEIPQIPPPINQASLRTLQEQTTETSIKVEEKKWSTFLQKPSNPKPVNKIENEFKGEPYRVVITKQPKRVPKAKLEPKVISEDKVETVEISQEVNANETEEEVTVRAEITEVEETEIELPESEETENECEEVVSEENSIIEKVEDEPQDSAADDSAMSETSLQEKLAEVQKQLLALAQLPSTIQMTINAVTEQLATIVAASVKSQPEQEVSETENDFTEQIISEEISCLSETEEATNEEEEEQEQEEQEEECVIEEEPIVTEEDEEAQRLEEELLKKQEKELRMLMEQRPLKPIDRPIILPGGRRWSQPDDACAVRHPKMSDEKIANTIETYSEVIIGKAKGINFLKYQPPPKNLDYLQRSDVYKLVHDMEPPVRGISSRASKILAEQDYYQTEGSI